MNSPVQKIKERLSIEEVVSSYIKLENSGQNLRARCPFHNEKTPSFFVSPARGSYYCFGCSASGDIFTFVEEFEGLDFKGALKLLAAKAGVSLGDFNQEKESEKERIYRALESTALFFERNLKESKEATEYVLGRGINEKTMVEFRIGFAKNGWDFLYQHLRGEKFTDREIEQAGLAKQGDKGMYDRFRSRIMFPITDTSGRVIAFSGRIFEKGLPVDVVEKSAKYLNSPDTPVFNKSMVLYGLDKAKDSIRKNNFSILVEGQMDLVLSHQAGFKNTVATSGTALSDKEETKERAVSNLGLVRRLSTNIVIAFDADKAGLNASSRASKIALSLGMDVKVAKMEKGLDPADTILQKGVDAWRGAIRESKHVIEFLLDNVLEDFKEDTRKAGREIKERVLPYVNFIESSIEKTHFLKRISDASGIPIEALQSDLKNIEVEYTTERNELEALKESGNKLFRKDHIERRLVGIVLWQKSLVEQKFDPDKVISELGRIWGKDEGKVLEDYEGSREDLIYEAEVFYTDMMDLKKEVLELLANLKHEYIKETLGKKMRELHLAETKGDKDVSIKILAECQILNNEIQDIKSGRVNNIFE